MTLPIHALALVVAIRRKSSSNSPDHQAWETRPYNHRGGVEKKAATMVLAPIEKSFREPTKTPGSLIESFGAGAYAGSTRLSDFSVPSGYILVELGCSKSNSLTMFEQACIIHN